MAMICTTRSSSRWTSSSHSVIGIFNIALFLVMALMVAVLIGRFHLRFFQQGNFLSSHASQGYGGGA